MSGLFGVVSSGDCVQNLFFGTDYHSHLGTQYGGLAVFGDNGVIHKRIHDIRQSQFKSKFYNEFAGIGGKSGIGVISAGEPQPLVFDTKFGRFALCSTGKVTNRKDLVTELLGGGSNFSESLDGEYNTTELLSKLITQGDNIVEGLAYMFSRIEGSVSVLLLCSDGIYAAVDQYCRFPLAVASGEDGWAVASESCAFPNIGYDVKKFLGPGEIVLITSDGMESVKSKKDNGKTCSFLWVYTGFPASSYLGINAEVVRERCGMQLAKKDSIKADLVSGVPDSGVAHAIGYSIQSKIPYRRALVKYTPGYGRSYIPPSQDVRDHIALMKLIPNRDIISGRNIVVCEDSIVRGTQLKNYTINKLSDSGAKEIHVRVACPPIMFPCRYNLSTKTLDELAARKAIKNMGDSSGDVSEYLDPDSDKYKKMIEWIRDDLNVASLKFQTVDDMIVAIGVPAEKLCTYCWRGNKD
jgi:amidophosphoribosyltransferase